MNGPGNSDDMAHITAHKTEEPEGKMKSLEEGAKQPRRSNRIRRTTWKVQEGKENKTESEAA